MRPAFSLMLLGPLLLTACGSADQPAGGLTPDQNAALDKAAADLDTQRADLPKRNEEPPKDQPKSE